MLSMISNLALEADTEITARVKESLHAQSRSRKILSIHSVGRSGSAMGFRGTDV
jgi:hypothetical protein